MTEGEWLTCTDPGAMLAALQGVAGDRKLRLFACACCRAVWPLLTDERSRQAVGVAERYADGEATEAELDAACERAEGALTPRTATGAYLGAWVADRQVLPACVALTGGDRCHRMGALPVPARMSAPLLRDILGNLFQPPSEFWFLPAGATQGHPRHVADVRVLAWNGGTVPRLARTIYRERCFEDLPVLADALEEAGCDDDGILAHCRRPRPHARGCWVVDLVRSVD